MASQETLDCMAELYQGEILGEIVNEALVSEFDDPLAKRVMLAMLQAESETKVRLRPAMVQLGLPVAASPSPELRAQAEAALASLKGVSWPDFLAAVRVMLTDQYIPRYQEIAKIAAADGDPVAIEVADHMVAHETAFLEMLDHIDAGDPNPTKSVDALLRFPMPAAAA